MERRDNRYSLILEAVCARGKLRYIFVAGSARSELVRLVGSERRLPLVSLGGNSYNDPS